MISRRAQRPPAVESTATQRFLEYAGVRSALERLLRCGLDSEVFFALFFPTAGLLAEKTDSRASQVPGLSRQQLARFPTKLREMADHLDRIDHNTYLMPGALGVNKGDIARLPKTLRARAFILTVQIAAKGRLGRTFESGIESEVKRNLVRQVRKMVGRPMFKEVSLLLSAALYAVGSAKEVTPESLKMLFSRRSSAAPK